MPFFWHKDNRKKCISKNNRPSLRDKTPVSTTFIKNVYLRSYPKKRVSSFTSCPFLNSILHFLFCGNSNIPWVPVL